MLRLKQLGFDALSVLFGLCTFLSCSGVMGAWDDPRIFGGALAHGAGIAVVLGFVWATVAVRRVREGFLRSAAVYESWGAFEALVREDRGVILDLGRGMVSQLSLVSHVLLGVVDGKREATLRELYDDLQRRREDASLSELDFRDAVDDLLRATRDASRRRL